METLDHARDRDTEAQAIATTGAHPMFPEMFSDMVADWQEVYDDLSGRPALVDITDFVGVGMELVVVTAEEYAGNYEEQSRVPVHSFITQLVSHRWRIGGLGRRLAVPGWPPTETEALTKPTGFS